MKRVQFYLATLAVILAGGFASANPPKGAYPFSAAPDRAHEKLAGLDPVSGAKFALSRDEARLFADASDGTLDTVSFAHACLLASGVTDREKRRAYRDKLDEIELAACKAVEQARTMQEAAEQLLKFLHAGPMGKGYEIEQSDLHVLLDTGTFNCVSSAMLYNVIGRRMGLDLRAVEVPGHVFAILYDGTERIDVETTSEHGFNPPPKGRPEAAERRELNEAGLAALVAFNRGVTLMRDKRFHEALLANFRALALDPLMSSASNNTVYVLSEWPTELIMKGEFERALSVLSTGIELAKQEDANRLLKNNALVVYDLWTHGLMTRGEWSKAIEVCERGLKQFPAEKYLADSLAFCREQMKK